MIKINLLPVKTRKKTQNHRSLYLFGVMLFIGLAVVGGLYFKNLNDLAKTRNDIVSTNQSIATLQGVYKEYQTIQKEKKEVERRIAVVEQMKQGRALAARIMYDLPSIMRDSVWLTKFRKDMGNFELEGRSLENESIAEFVESMGKIPYYRNVELKTIEDATEEGVVVKKFIVQGNVGL
jgi:type IV pilus assembly protein PilN